MKLQSAFTAYCFLLFPLFNLHGSCLIYERSLTLLWLAAHHAHWACLITALLCPQRQLLRRRNVGWLTLWPIPGSIVVIRSARLSVRATRRTSPTRCCPAI